MIAVERVKRIIDVTLVSGLSTQSSPRNAPGNSTRFSLIPARYFSPNGDSDSSFRFAPVRGALVSILVRSSESWRRLQVR